MKVGILGAGALGSGLGKRLATAGHDVWIGFARSAQKVEAAAAEIGHGAQARGVEDVARHGEVVIFATPWSETLSLAASLAPFLIGKVVWDTTNPYAPDMSELVLGTTTSAGEEVARALPGARVVKAVPPFAELLHAGNLLVDGRPSGAFVCGDDEKARAIVVGLLADVGAGPVDAGPLKLARFTEPAGMLVTNLAYVRGFGGRSGLSFLTEPQR